MTVSFRSRLFLLVCSVPLLRLQLPRWLQLTRWELRVAVAAIAGSLAAGCADFLAQLPAGSFEVVLRHLPSVPGAWVGLVLLTIAVMSVVLAALAAAAARTLF